LTEQDLNRLDAYIRDKNRLHTLQLHGWGVVNGLEVLCNSCGPGVVVGCGYAIGPCGDDIVVCEDVAVDICAMIRKCRQQDVACQPYTAYGSPKECDDAVEEWVLAVRYAETPARGIAALRKEVSAAAGSGCGKPGGKCTCASTGSAGSPCNCSATSTEQKSRTAPAECEPTVICEGYAFDVFRLPEESRDGRNREIEFGGPLWERLMCCFTSLRDVIPTLPDSPGRDSFMRHPDEWRLWCCRAKEALAAYLSIAPTSGCTLIAELQAAPCPDLSLGPEAFAIAMEDVFKVFVKVFVDAVLGCFCSALLPPCPDPAPDDRVPLAVIRVRRRDCVVLSVCNWTPLRRLVLTAPTLSYWLSVLPILRSPAELIHRLCCEPRSIKFERPPAGMPQPPRRDPTGAAAIKLNPELSHSTLAMHKGFTQMMDDADARGDRPLDPMDFARSLFRSKIEVPDKELSEVERANLPQFLVLNQILRPIAASMRRREEDTSPAYAEADTPAGEGMQELKLRVKKLEETIEAMKGKASSA
jgi:hypothetical protein